MKAKLAFTAVSEIPLFGSRAAAISCCSEASTKALEVVPKAFFNLCRRPMRGRRGAGRMHDRYRAAGEKPRF
jgi:hypothetical protein